MLKIRLRKPGKSVKRRYHWKIVVMEAHTARDGKFVEEIGHYDPSRKLLKFDVGLYESWVKKGAQPTQTVGTLFKRYMKSAQASSKAA